jgi:hypothetical protein
VQYTLDLPWGVKHEGVYYDRDNKVHVFKGAILPAALRNYRPEDFSYTRWVEDEKNGMVMQPEKGTTIFKPREHQLEAASKILQAYNAGWGGFLEADKTGLGKTLSVLSGITAIAKRAGFGVGKKAKVLIVCPKDVIPQWRQTLHNYPLSAAVLRPLIVNYEQLNKLLKAPANARVVKKTRTKNRQISSKGVAKDNWDFVVFDEAHKLKNFPKSGTSLAAVRVAQLHKPYKKGDSPFVVYSTATPGATPLNLAIMANILAPLLSKEPGARSVTPELWGPFLEKQGFAVTKGKVDYNWAQLPWPPKPDADMAAKARYQREVKKAKAVQRLDTHRIGKALLSKDAPFIMRAPKDIAGWPEQLPVPLPVEMSSGQKMAYQEAWTAFRDWLRLTPANGDPKGALVQQLRYRQKASLIKVPSVVDSVVDWVEAGNQVFISCQFLETVDSFREKLEAKKIRVCEISGRSTEDRTETRVAFQKGQYDVVISTVVAGISLHAGETLPDGTQATATPRISVIHDVRQNNLDTEQAMGRAHRDGQNSVTYFPYLERTIEERVIDSFVSKTGNMRSMTGASAEGADELENIFREAASRTTPPNRLS